MDFDDLLVRTVNLLELFADVREKYRRIFRWVLVDEYQDTNRAQYRMLQLLAEEHRNLTVVGDDFQAVYSFRGADIRNILEFERDFPDADDGSARAELPLDADDPRRRQRADRPQRRPEAEAPVDRRPARRADRRRRVRRRARRGSLRRLRDQPAGRGGDVARPDRGLLPGERAEPGARGHAGAVRDPLPGDRRDEVLRAGRDQGRGRLPAAARQPRRRDLVRARRQLAAARDRPADPGADALAREHDRRRRLGGARQPDRDPGPRLGGAEGGRPLRRDDGGAAPARRASADRSPSCSRRPCTRPATSRRSRPSARSRPRAGSRTSRSWSASPASSTPTASSRATLRSPRWRSSSPRSRWSPTRTTSARRRAWRR